MRTHLAYGTRTQPIAFSNSHLLYYSYRTGFSAGFMGAVPKLVDTMKSAT